MREEIALLLEAAGIPHGNSGVFIWSYKWTLTFRSSGVSFQSWFVIQVEITSPAHALSLILEAQS